MVDKIKFKIKRRPRRLFYDEKSKKYFYLINNKKKYIKINDGISAKAISKINIQNILPVSVRKKTIRPRASIKPITNQQINTKFVPIAPIAQNLSERYSLYKASDDLEKKLTKLEQQIKTKDIKEVKDKSTQDEKEEKKKKQTGIQDFFSKTKKSTQDETKMEPEGKDQSKGFFGSFFTPKKTPKPSTLTPIDKEETKKKQTGIQDFFSTTKKRIDDDSKEEVEPIDIGVVKTVGRGISTFMNNMSGSGAYENDDDGIFNTELQEIFKDKMNKFLPVIPADKMDELLPLVNKDTKKFGWIQNTENSDSMGRHWVAYFIDIPNLEVNYYDSLTENDGEPPKESLKGLKKIIDKIHPEYYLLFKYNQIQDQSPSSKNCGYFALKFIMDRYRNVPFKVASGFDKHYYAGEKMIKRFKKYL